MKLHQQMWFIHVALILKARHWHMFIVMLNFILRSRISGAWWFKDAFILYTNRKQQSHASHLVIIALHIENQLLPYDEETKYDYIIVELPHSVLITRMIEYELHKKN